MKLIKPQHLQKGDCIGIIAPSAGSAQIFSHRIETAKKFIINAGYKVKFANHALQRSVYISASAQLRADDIHSMFKDEQVRAIICTIGGDHSNQILKYLDFSLISKNPKIFMGYSDISVLHYAILSKSNLQTFYGPCIMTQFGEHPSILPYTLEHFTKAVVLTQPIGDIKPSKDWTCEILDWTVKKDLERPRKMEISQGYEWLKEGSVTSHILGGCVPSINHLAGTQYWIDPTGSIFFIDIPEGHDFGKGLAISQLDSYLADLDNLGVFKNIAGLIVGRPYNYSAEEYAQLKKLILYYTQGYNYPILMNANIGHCDPIITLPYAVQVTLDSAKDKFSINEAGVR